MKKRINNKMMFLLSILILFLVIGAASANDNISTDSMNNEVLTSTDDVNQDDALSQDMATENSMQTENTNTTVLGDTAGTFTDLQNLINSGQNTINLDKDYKFDSAKDSNLKDGIKINNAITINGNNKTIDANNLARIFTITANNVVLDGIIFKNAAIHEEVSYSGTSNINTTISRANGASIFWSGDNGVLRNSIITGSSIDVTMTLDNTHDCDVNYYVANGAGVYLSGNNALIENTQFINNTLNVTFNRLNNVYDTTTNNIKVVMGNGIGLYMNGNNNTIRKSKFQDHTITQKTNQQYNVELGGSTGNSNTLNKGSSIYMAGDSNTVDETIFTNNTSPDGAALYWTGDNGKVVNSTFTYNTATNNGGAISWNGYYAEITGSTFKNNNAKNRGAITISSYGGKISGSHFYNNHATTDVGAVYWTGNWGSMNDCDFDANTAGSNCAAVYWSDNNGAITDCTFTNNVAGASGTFTCTGNGRLINSTFKNNTAGTNGGAVTWTGSSGTIDGCTFIDNAAKGQGGAIYASGNAVNIFNNVFTGNKANTGGNGIYIKSPNSVSLKNNTIDPDDVSSGIKLEARDFYVSPDGIGSGTVDDPTSFYHAYEKIATGYNIILTPGTYYNILNQGIGKTVNIIGQNGAIIDLNATNRAFSVTGIGVNVKNIIFKNGRVSGDGGAITWTGYMGTIDNCTFINNTATGKGGAVNFNAWSATVKNSIFIDNNANSANDINAPNGITLTGNTFTGSYIVCDDEIVLNYQNNRVKITPGNEDIAVTVKLNGKTTNKFIIPANSKGDTRFNLSDVAPGEYVLEVLFNSNSNHYVNTQRVFITVLGEQAPIYVSPSGGKDGSNKDNPTDLDDALSRVTPGGTIILVDGIYKEATKTINVDGLTIKSLNGKDKTIFSTGNQVFTINADNVVIDGITFTRNNDKQFRAITWEGNNGILNNSKFTKFSYGSVGAGAAVWWHNGLYGGIYNSEFSDNTCNYGGALYLTKFITVEKCNFTNNAANDYGGAVRVDGAKVTFTGCIFINNTARNAAGAIAFDGALASVENCIFENNTAGTNGGAIRFNSYLSSVTGSTFINNNATTCNDVYCAYNTTITNNKFIGSYINPLGVFAQGYTGPFTVKITSSNENITGTIYIDGSKVDTFIIPANHKGNPEYSLPDTIIVGNHTISMTFTTGNGNSYSNINTQTFNVTSPVFYVNVTGNGTGLSPEDPTNWTYAINHAVTGSKIILLNGTYNNWNNQAIGLAGLTIQGSGNTTLVAKDNTRFFRINSNNVIIDNIKFMNSCRVDKNLYSISQAAGIYWTGNNGILKNCIFQNITYNYNYITQNTGSLGAALYVDGSELTIDNCQFFNNSATRGAAIYSTKSITIINSLFKDNIGSLGVAIYLDGNNKYNITNCIFTNNQANLENAALTMGGAIYGTNTINTYISNSRFINNSADISNDIYYTNGITLNNNTFIGSYLVAYDQVIGSFLPNKVKISAPGENITAYLTLNDNIKFNVTIVANTTGDTYFDLPSNLSPGEYTINVKFSNEKYQNNIEQKFIIKEQPVFYVNVTGNGTGSADDPTNWTYAINHVVPGSKIILLDGVYSEFNYEDINVESLTIEGSANTIIDGQGKNRFLKISADNVKISNITFINGFNSASTFALIDWEGHNGIITHSQFINLTAAKTRGTLQVNGFNITIDDCLFTNTTGFTLLLYGAGSTLKNTKFIKASSSGSDRVGMVQDKYKRQVKDYIDNCTFDNILSPFVVENDVEIKNSNFTNNHCRLILHNKGNCLIDNCIFINNTGANEGVVKGTSSLNIMNSRFINNSAVNGGTVSSSGTITDSIFINNTASGYSNDIYGNPTLSGNTFIGTYAHIPEKVEPGDTIIPITATADDKDIVVFINVNGKEYKTIIPANKQGNTEYTLENLSSGEYTLGLRFITVGSNTYINNNNTKFTVASTAIYVSPNGTGDGSFDNPANWTYAYSIVKPNGKIILLNGTYTDILNQEISIEGLIIEGSGNTILDAEGKDRIFMITSSNVEINNIIFQNGYDKNANDYGSFIRWDGINGKLYNSIFQNSNAKKYMDVLFKESASNCEINNCSFINCNVNKRGLQVQTTGKIINCKFINETYGLFLHGTSKKTVINCTFDNAGLYIYQGSFDVQKSTFDSSSTITYNAVSGVFSYNTVLCDSKDFGEYNWYGVNDPEGVTVPYLNINFTSPIRAVQGEFNYLGEVYFYKNGTDERIDQSLFPASLTWTVNTGSADLSINENKIYGFVTGDDTLNISLYLNDYHIGDLIIPVSSDYSLSDLQFLIDNLPEGETLTLHNNYTFQEGDSSIVINKSMTLNGNNHFISANGSDNILNISVDDVSLNNIILKDAKESAIISTGANTNIENATLNNVNGTGVQIEGRNANIGNLTVEGGEGTAVDIMGTGATLSNVTITDYKGTGIDASGNNIKISDVNVNDVVSDDAAISVSGTGTTVSNVMLNDVNGTGINVTGKMTKIDSVSVKDGEGTAITTSGLGTEINEVKVENYTGTGINSTGNGVIVDNINIAGGSGDVAVELSGYTQANNVNLTNYTGSGVKSTGDGSIIDAVNVNGVEGTGVIITGDETNVANVNLTNHKGDGIVVPTGNNVTIQDIQLDNITSGAGVKLNGNGSNINGVVAKNSDNITVVDVTGDNTAIGKINLDNITNSTGVKTNGTSNNVDNVTVKDGSDVTAVDSTGNNNTVGNVDLNNATSSIGVKTNGTSNNVDNVTVKDSTDVTAVDSTGNNNTVGNVDLNNATGSTGVKTNGTSNNVDNVTVKDSADVTAVDSTGNNNTVGNVDLNNATGSIGVKTNGTGNNIGDINVNNSTNITAADITGNNNTILGVNDTGSNSTVKINGNGTTVGNITDNVNISSTEPIIPNIIINIPNLIHDDDKFNITVFIDNRNNKGTVTVSIPESGFVGSYRFENGTIIIPMDALNIVGNYTINVAFVSESPIYANNTATKKFTVKNWNFTELQELIENPVNGTVDLGNHTFVYSEGDPETITVPENTKVNGAGSTIDAGNKTGIFNITNNNVTLSDMTLTNVNGTAISGEANNIKINGVDIKNATNGIEITGDNPVLENITVSDIAEDAVYVDAGDTDAIIDNVDVNRVEGSAIDVYGNNVTVKGSDVVDAGEGISVTADGNVVVENVTADTIHEGDAIGITGDNVTVKDTAVSNVEDGEGIFVEAEGNAKVENTTVDTTSENAIDVTAKDIEIKGTNVTEVGKGIIANATEGNVNIENVTANTVSEGTAITATGNNVTVKDTNLTDVMDAVKVDAAEDAKLDNVDVNDAEGKAIDVTAGNDVEIKGSDLNNVTEGITANATQGNVDIANVTADNVTDGAAITATGNNVNLSNTTLTDVVDAVKVDAAEDAKLDNVDVTDAKGKAIDAHAGNDVEIKGSDLNNVTGGITANATQGNVDIANVTADNVTDGAAITATGNNVSLSNTTLTDVAKGADITATDGDATVENVKVTNVTDDALDVNAENGKADVSGVTLTNATGDNGLNVNSQTANVDNVTVDGGKGENAVNVNTKGDANVSNVNMTGYTGTGVNAESENGNVEVTNTTATGGNGTAVKANAPNGTGTVSGTVLDNCTGNSTIVNAANATVTNTTISGNSNVTNPVANGTQSSNVDPVKYDADKAFNIPESSSSTPEYSINMPKDATGDLVVMVDGKEAGRATLKDGQATVKVPELANGDHNITVQYTGDSNYAAISKNITHKVTRKDVTISAPGASLNLVYGGAYSVTLKDSNGNVLVGKTVTLSINGKSYTATSDANGVARFNLNKAALKSAGGKTVTVKFAGDSTYNPASATAKITVVKDKPRITAKSVKKTYKKSKTKKIKITLKTSKKKAIKGKFKVKVKVNKKLAGKIGKKLKKGYTFKVTFKKGVGYIKLTNSKVKGFKKGTYKFTVTFKGNSLYKAVTKKNIKMKIK